MSESKNWKRDLLEELTLILVVLAILGAGGVSLQLYLGTPTPLLAVESGSMEPTLYRGDLVIVRAVDPETLKVGDIIIFHASWCDVPVVHRIIEVQHVGDELQFITKGDNNPTQDHTPVHASDVIAKVIASVRYLGFVTLLLLLAGGLFYIIILLVVFLLASLICDALAPKEEDTTTDMGTGRMVFSPT